ncbi:MAG TPA: sigma-54 dependent transcriptional regulator [Thermoanaerobaculia bacterium]|nr:sigma-54 dependent transcriptional regulator [Thermoanaerobaculia bacterium]
MCLRVLVVDDDPLCRATLERMLCRDGHEVATAGNVFVGLELLATMRPHVLFIELRMPGLDALTFADHARTVSPATRVVVMTALGTVAAVVEAMRRGADDFLEKPIDERALCRTLARTPEPTACRPDVDDPGVPGTGTAARLGVIGDHPSMRAALQRAEQVAPSRVTVLISGETGTGKGLLAETIHRLSPRAQGPFVELPCVTVSESLLDSELFGHEKGAFTGAVGRREGRLRAAEGGTLFLDEIGSCPLPMQAKLLRFLQSRRFERVGGNEVLTVNTRLIAATNRDLEKEVARGRFRADLYYRLNVFQIVLPPLRLRRSDVPALAQSFLQRFATENERRIEGFSREALERLTIHSWPGNVRELEHAVEHAVVMARGRQVIPQDLPDSVLQAAPDPLNVTIPGSTLADIERAAILKSLMAVGGKATDAAAMLGISKSKIYYRLKDYGWEGEEGA